MSKKSTPGTIPLLQLELFAIDAFTFPVPQPDFLPLKPQEKPLVSSEKRSIVLNGLAVEYEFRRSKRKSIGFLVNENGLRVTAPARATLKAVEQALMEKSQWITAKIRYFFEQTEKRKTQPLPLGEGTSLPFLGRDLVLRLKEAGLENVQMMPEKGELIVKAGNTANQTAESILKSWLQQQAHGIFLQRLAFYSEKLGVPFLSFSLSSARQRWGSCSVSGNIRLNWRLVHFPLHLIDYVVVHELAHLREMNHGRRFWNIVQEAFPDYKKARKELREQSRQLFFLP